MRKLIAGFAFLFLWVGNAGAQNLISIPVGSTYGCSYSSSGNYLSWPPPWGVSDEHNMFVDFDGSGTDCVVPWLINQRQLGNTCVPILVSYQGNPSTYWANLANPITNACGSQCNTVLVITYYSSSSNPSCGTVIGDYIAATNVNLACPYGSTEDPYTHLCNCPNGTNPYAPPATIPYIIKDGYCVPDPVYFNPFYQPYRNYPGSFGPLIPNDKGQTN